MSASITDELAGAVPTRAAPRSQHRSCLLQRRRCGRLAPQRGSRMRGRPV